MSPNPSLRLAPPPPPPITTTTTTTTTTPFLLLPLLLIVLLLLFLLLIVLLLLLLLLLPPPPLPYHLLLLLTFVTRLLRSKIKPTVGPMKSPKVVTPTHNATGDPIIMMSSSQAPKGKGGVKGFQ